MDQEKNDLIRNLCRFYDSLNAQKIKYEHLTINADKPNNLLGIGIPNARIERSSTFYSNAKQIIRRKEYIDFLINPMILKIEEDSINIFMACNGGHLVSSDISDSVTEYNKMAKDVNGADVIFYTNSINIFKQQDEVHVKAGLFSKLRRVRNMTAGFTIKDDDDDLYRGELVLIGPDTLVVPLYKDQLNEHKYYEKLFVQLIMG